MKATRFLLLFTALITTNLRADNLNTTLDLSNYNLQPDVYADFDWDDQGIWTFGVPSPNSNVSMPTQYIEIYDPETEETSSIEADVNIYLTQPTTIASLDLGYSVELYWDNRDLNG